MDNPNPPKRHELKPGMAVWIIEKENYGTDNYKQGIIARVLSPGEHHSRGIKVMLEDGSIGRAQWIIRD